MNDYMNMNISQLELDSTWGFKTTFFDNNITLVSQILDDQTMYNIYEGLRKKSHRDELLGFIDLVKYKVYNLSLTTDVYLDYDAKVMEDILSDSCEVNFSRMGFTSDGENELEKLKTLYDNFKMTHNSDNDYTIYDVFFNEIDGHVLESDFEKKLKIFIDSYQGVYMNNPSLDLIRRDLIFYQKRKDQVEYYNKLIEKKISVIDKGGVING